MANDLIASEELKRMLTESVSHQMANGDWELDYHNFEEQEKEKRRTDYCPVCDGKGPATLPECPTCHRLNPEQQRKGK